MLDLKIIREKPEAVKTRLKRRGSEFNELDELLKPEEDRRLASPILLKTPSLTAPMKAPTKWCANGERNQNFYLN